MTGVWTQPVEGSQASVVHASPSEHSTVHPTHAPAMHWPVVTHESEQGVPSVSGTCRHAPVFCVVFCGTTAARLAGNDRRPTQQQLSRHAGGCEGPARGSEFGRLEDEGHRHVALARRGLGEFRAERRAEFQSERGGQRAAIDDFHLPRRPAGQRRWRKLDRRIGPEVEPRLFLHEPRITAAEENSEREKRAQAPHPGRTTVCLSDGKRNLYAGSDQLLSGRPTRTYRNQKYAEATRDCFSVTLAFCASAASCGPSRA